MIASLESWFRFIWNPYAWGPNISAGLIWAAPLVAITSAVVYRRDKKRHLTTRQIIRDELGAVGLTAEQTGDSPPVT